jgi:hypothetical protein
MLLAIYRLMPYPSVSCCPKFSGIIGVSKIIAQSSIVIRTPWRIFWIPYTKCNLVRYKSWARTHAVSHVTETLVTEMECLKEEFAMATKAVTVDYVSQFDLSVFRNCIMLSAPILWKLVTTCAHTRRAEENNKRINQLYFVIITRDSEAYLY